jgi:hypothetical protein
MDLPRRAFLQLAVGAAARAGLPCVMLLCDLPCRPNHKIVLLEFFGRASDPPTEARLGRFAMADEKLVCSFCRRSSDDFGHLLAGPGGVAVCDDCLGHLSTIMAKHRPEWGAALAEQITTLRKLGH